MRLTLGDYTLQVGGRPLIMGILNVAPDSFWDGGRYTDVSLAVARAEEMVNNLVHLAGNLIQEFAEGMPFHPFHQKGPELSAC